LCFWRNEDEGGDGEDDDACFLIYSSPNCGNQHSLVVVAHEKKGRKKESFNVAEEA